MVNCLQVEAEAQWPVRIYLTMTLICGTRGVLMLPNNLLPIIVAFVVPIVLGQS
jgi:hypothetical protein